MIFLIVCTRVYASLLPVPSDKVVEHLSDGVVRQTTLPLWNVRSLTSVDRITFTLTVPSRISPRIFIAAYALPITSVRVNGIAASIDSMGRLDLRDVLHIGPNAVEFVLSGSPYQLKFLGIRPSFLSLLTILYFLGTTVTLLVSVVVAHCYSLVRFRDPVLLMLFALGIMLSSAYMSSTPFYLRSFDWIGHVDYIRHLANTLSLPLSLTSWQAHQPPLYYIFCTPIVWFSRIIGLGEQGWFFLLQQVSNLLTIGILWMGLKLIERTCEKGSSQRLAAALLVTFPGVLTLSSQISNDVLVTFIACIWTLCLTVVVGSSQLRTWQLLSLGALIGCGILTKLTMVPLLCLTLLILFLSNRCWLAFLRSVACISLSCAMVIAPYALWRFHADERYSSIANATYMANPKVLQPSLREIFTFNPFAVVLHSYVDESVGHRSVYFLESIFRRGFVISNASSVDGSVLLALAMLLLPLTFVGIVRSVWERHPFIPMVLIGSLFMLLLFRLVSPYSSSQHFRYVAFTAPFLATATARGIEMFRAHRFHLFLIALVAIYCIVAIGSLVGMVIV